MIGIFPFSNRQLNFPMVRCGEILQIDIVNSNNLLHQKMLLQLQPPCVTRQYEDRQDCKHVLLDHIENSRGHIVWMKQRLDTALILPFLFKVVIANEGLGRVVRPSRDLEFLKDDFRKVMAMAGKFYQSDT